MPLYVEQLAGKMLFRAPIAEAQPRAHPNVVPRPTKRRTLKKKKKEREREKNKTKQKNRGGWLGREVVVYWSLTTLEMKTPMEGAEAVSFTFKVNHRCSFFHYVTLSFADSGSVTPACVNPSDVTNRYQRWRDY